MLISIVGPMSSGKTEYLIELAQTQFINLNKKILVYKPKIDTRDGVNIIRSRSGREIEAKSIDNPEEILTDYAANQNTECIFIDEVQFFNNSLCGVLDCLRMKCDIICSGLTNNFKCEPFETTAILMAISDDIMTFKSTCALCGRPTVFTKRLVESNDAIVIGGSESYEPRCRKCFEI